MTIMQQTVLRLVSFFSVFVLSLSLSACGNAISAEERADYEKIGEAVKASGLNGDSQKEFEQKFAAARNNEEVSAVAFEAAEKLEIMASQLKAFQPQSEKGTVMHGHFLRGSSKGAALMRRFAEADGNDTQALKEIEAELETANQEIEQGLVLFIEMTARNILQTATDQNGK